MAHASIDLFLQNTGPLRATADLTRPSTGNARRFDEHFSRAAQNTAARLQSPPEPTSHPQDDVTARDQRTESSHSSHPDDSHQHEETNSDSKTNPIDTTKPNKPPEKDPESTDDVVEISSSAQTHAATAQPIEAGQPLATAAQATKERSAEELAPTENDTHAAAETNGVKNSRVKRQATDPTAGQRGTADAFQAATISSREESTGKKSSEKDTAQPATGTDAASSQAASATNTSPGLPAMASGPQTGTQDAALELATQATKPPGQADSQTAADPATGNRPSSGKSARRTMHGDAAGADPGIPDQLSAKDRQAIRKTGPSSGKETAANMAIPLPTDGMPAPEVADRALNRMAAAHSIQPARPTSEQPSVPAVDRARFVGRVSSALRLAHQRDGHLKLQLSPPELGSLRLEISVKHGVLTATMETHTAAARHVLLENLPALRERLAGQDIRIERFDVDVRHGGGEQSQNQAAQQRPGDQSQGRPSAPRRPAEPLSRPTDNARPIAPGPFRPAPDGLDVLI